MHSVKSSRVEKHSERSEKKHTSSRKRGGAEGETCRTLFDNYDEGKKQELINNFLMMDTFFLYKLALEEIKQKKDAASAEEPSSAPAEPPADTKRLLEDYKAGDALNAFDVVYEAMNSIANAIKLQSGACPEIKSVMFIDDKLNINTQNLSQDFVNFTDITNANITNILKWCREDPDFQTFDSKKQQIIEANPLKEKLRTYFL